MDEQKKVQSGWSREGKAFQMFVEEVDRNVGEAEKVLELGNKTDPKLQNDVCIHFHQTKGVAGMFGLDDVAKAAAALEEAFGGELASILANNIEVNNLLQQIKISMQEIKDA